MKITLKNTQNITLKTTQNLTQKTTLKTTQKITKYKKITQKLHKKTQKTT